jgi:hypothetical protein
MFKKNKLIVVVLLVLFVLLPLFTGIIGFYTDWLFFSET